MCVIIFEEITTEMLRKWPAFLDSVIGIMNVEFISVLFLYGLMSVPVKILCNVASV